MRKIGGFRITPRTRRRPSSGVWPPRYALTRQHFDRLRQIEELHARLAHFGLTTAARHLLWREALTRNAYGTASIEGNPLSLSDVESLLARTPGPTTGILPEEREILNYVGIVEDIDHHPPPSSIRELEKLHAELFAGVLEDCGRLKTQVNFVGTRPANEVVYLPTEPHRVRAELDHLLRWYQTEPEHALVRILLFHHEFEAIHPFRDGNGRLGRLVLTLQLYHGGYPSARYAPIDFMVNDDRSAYYRALAAVQKSWERTPWLSYGLDLLQRAFSAALERFQFRGGIADTVNERQAGVAEWLRRLTREHADLRVKLNDVHAAFPTIPLRTLQQDLAHLVKARIFERQGTRKAATYGFLPRRHERPSGRGTTAAQPRRATFRTSGRLD